MRKGEFFEYCWEDILKLIYKESGIEEEEDRRIYCKLWYKGDFVAPIDTDATMITVEKHDSPVIDGHKS